MTRVAVAGFQHETNTFAPFPTPLSLFEAGGAWPAVTRGEALRDTMQGLNIPLAGFMAACSHEVIPLLWAGAEPGGYVEEDAFEQIAGEIIEGVRAAAPDAVYLDLHGAMVTRAFDDAEAELLRRLRVVIGPDTPLVASFDLHANLGPEVSELASAVTLYRTYPHVDLAKTGARAAALLEACLKAPLGKGYAQVDLLVPITAQSTEFSPARGFYAGLEDYGVRSADIAMGFPPADIPMCGPSVFAYDPDPAKAQKVAEAIAAQIATSEEIFDARLMSAAEAVTQAKAISGPVVIADPQDNPGAGGTGDTTGVLQALIDAQVPDAVLSMLYDPAAAAQAHAAGQGAEIDVSLGGATKGYGAPVRMRARVETLSDGTFAFTGPMFGGATAHLGRIAGLALIGTGVKVVVGSRRAQNADQEMFRVVGIEPRDHAIICVKSGVHFMADYLRVTDQILFAQAPGANPCDLSTLPYKHLRNGVKLGPGGPTFVK
ncbi:MAG: M81 family metallopeptidase [Pseudomonadota bacterium]